MKRWSWSLLASLLVHGMVLVVLLGTDRTPRVHFKRGTSSVRVTIQSAHAAGSSDRSPGAESKGTSTVQSSNPPRSASTDPRSRRETDPSDPPSADHAAASRGPQKKSDRGANGSGKSVAGGGSNQGSASRQQSGPGSDRTNSNPSRRHRAVRTARDALYRRNPSPPYPVRARVRGIEGTVRLMVRVNPSGRPTRVKVHERSSSKLLDRAARNTVREWKFRPRIYNGSPVASWVIVPIQFKLKQ